MDNQRQQHDLQQGSDEWMNFRFNHDGASEIAAVMGLSRKKTRSQLMRIKYFGIAEEFSDYVQEILDEGHEIEAMARPIAEKIIGSELYPTTWSLGRMSASCDGLTAMDNEGWENKQYNAEYFAMVQAGEVPEEHMPQIQQCLMVTGAERWFFTVSDGTEERTVGVWVYPDHDYFDRIQAAWDLFNKDLETYTPPEIIIQPKPDVIPDLPTLFIHAKGEITTSNMREYGDALAERLADVRAIVLVDDKDFVNAKAAAKKFREQIEKLKVTKAGMLAQTTTIGEAAAMIDAWAEDLRVTALQLEKNVEREDLLKKEAMISAARARLASHVTELQSELAVVLNMTTPNFAEAIKGKRSYEIMQQTVDGVLANAKLDADAVAKDLREKHTWYIKNAGEYSFLFSDLQTLIYKDFDSFKAVAQNRVLAHKEQEKAKAEAAAKAQAEREEKICKEAEEKARREEQERFKAEAEAKAKAIAEAAQAMADAEEQAYAEKLERENQAELEHAAAKAEQKRIVDHVDTDKKDGGDQTQATQDIDIHEDKEPSEQANADHVGEEAIAPERQDVQEVGTVLGGEAEAPSWESLVMTIAAQYDVDFNTANKWLVLRFSSTQQ